MFAAGIETGNLPMPSLLELKTAEKQNSTISHAATQLMLRRERAFKFHIQVMRNHWPHTVEHTSSYISNAFSRSRAPAPPKNRVFPQLTGIPWCSVTFLVWTICRGGGGGQGIKMLILPQQDYFVVAELLTLGTFTFLWLKTYSKRIPLYSYFYGQASKHTVLCKSSLVGGMILHYVPIYPVKIYSILSEKLGVEPP